MKTETMTVKLSKRLALQTKIDSFSVRKDGRGKVVGTDGIEKAVFRVQRMGKKQSNFDASVRFNFRFNRSGAEAISSSCIASRDKNGVVTVGGHVNRIPFKVRVSGYGRRLKGTVPPRIKPADRKVLAAMVSAFEEKANSHFDAAGCALAGVEIIVSAFTLHAVGVAFGFIGMLLAC